MSSPGSQVVDSINEEELSISALTERDQVDKDHINVVQEQSEPEPRITRVRTLTEKGQAYQDQRQREHEKDEDQLIKKFHETYDAWETQAIYIESFMAKQLPLSQIEKEEAILRLKNLYDKTEKIYDKIRNDRAPGQETRQKMDKCDALTHTLERKFIRGESAASRNEEDVRSVRSRSSRASRRSGRSRTSRSSKAPSVIDVKRADAAAELAVREVEFNILKEEAKHKEATVRIEAELKTKLAQRKLKLEQLEAKKQIEIARAKLRAYQEVKEFTDELDSVEDDPLDPSPIPIDFETEAASLHQPQERGHSASDGNIPNPTTRPANQP